MRKLSSRKVFSFIALALTGAMLLAGTPVERSVEASSHREAPRIIEDPLADNTDVYAFVSPDAPTTVTLISNFIPLEEPSQGPNFYRFDDNVLYEIKVDNNGDAVEDISIQFRFQTQVGNPNTFLYNTNTIDSLDDPDWNVKQFMTVSVVRGGTTTVLGTNLRTPPVNIGPRSTPNYEALAAAAINTINTGFGPVRVFAGQRDEGFYIDTGSIFDLLGLRPFNQFHLAPLPNAPGVDTLAGFNVHTLAIQVPIAAVTRDGLGASQTIEPVLGVWSTASRQAMRVFTESGEVQNSGPFVQVSRLGSPLINEVINPLRDKNRFLASRPVNDAQFLPNVLDPEPARLLPILYPPLFGPSRAPAFPGVPPPPRNDLATLYLTGVPGFNQPANVVPSEQARLNVSVPPSSSPSRLGALGGDLAGFPNGRRVGDDVVDISLRAIAGATPLTPAFNVFPNNALGDGVNGNDRPYLTSFPYLATPVSGYDTPHGSTVGSGPPTAP